MIGMGLTEAPASLTRALDSGERSDLIRVILQSHGPGVVRHSGRPQPVVVLHVGRPVRMECSQGVDHHAGLAIHGDISVMPAHMPGRWEMKENDTALLLGVAPHLLSSVADALGDAGANDVELRSRFHIRDPQIEHIAWALQADVQQNDPGTRLYVDSLATALAVQLLQRHSSFTRPCAFQCGALPPRRLREVLTFIEEHLHEELRLSTIASVAGVSPSHLKVLFRGSVGMPVHQYVIRCRVDRAASLLERGVPISEVAAQTGFAHQSHLARHVRRILGVSPRELTRRRTTCSASRRSR